MVICDICRWNASHVDIRMLVELNSASGLGHRITDIKIGRDGNRREMSIAAPIQKGKVSNVDMSSALGWGLCFNHKYGAGVIHVKLCRLRKIETQFNENRADVQDHLPASDALTNSASVLDNATAF